MEKKPMILELLINTEWELYTVLGMGIVQDGVVNL